METVGSRPLWSFLSSHEEITNDVSNRKIRKDHGFPVRDYKDLVRRVAELRYKNPDHVLVFRGQSSDYTDRNGQSSLRPSLMRGERISEFKKLKYCEGKLSDYYEGPDKARFQRHQALRWAILQHYEVCGTPLLDVTTSLRIAASFAALTGSSNCFIYALAIPNLSGAITASNEAGLEVIRLSNVCPPEAIRPHIQEGYLLSEFPEIGTQDQLEHYQSHELDFGKRIIGKFRFNPSRFWDNSSGFPPVGHDDLYPDISDPFFRLCQEIKTEMKAVFE